MPKIDELAKEVGVSRQTLHKWFKDGCPRRPVAKIIAWRKNNKLPLRGKLANPSDGGESPKEKGQQEQPLQEQLLRAKIRDTQEAARKKEIANAVRMGDLVSRSEVIAEFADFLSQAKPLMESFVDDATKETRKEDRPRQRELASNAVTRFFKKLAAWRPATEAEDAGTGFSDSRSSSANSDD